MNCIWNNNATILDSEQEAYDISVCIIAYNKKSYIEKTINSVLSQKTTCSYEIIVGDNASTDGTTEILKNYWKSNKEKFCILINNENLGITANHFNVMAKAKGKYIMILNGDDYWKCQDKMQMQFDFLEKNAEYVGVTGPLECIYDKETDVFRILPTKSLWNRKITLDDYLNGYDFPLVGAMFRNDIFSSNFEHFAIMPKASKEIDDLAFCILLLMKGDVFIHSGAVGVYRCYHKNSGAENFNSTNPVKKRCIGHVQLCNNLDKLAGGSLDLSMRYGFILSTGFAGFLKKEVSLKDYKDIVGALPAKYRRRSCILLIKGNIRKMQLRLGESRN